MSPNKYYKMQATISTLYLILVSSSVSGWSFPVHGPRSSTSSSNERLLTEQTTTTTSHQLHNSSSENNNRRSFLHQTLLLSLTTTTICPQQAVALVKGNAPPPKAQHSSSSSTAKKKCSNIEQCQELTDRQLEADRETDLRASTTTPPQIAPGGTRYRDIQVGSDSGDSYSEGTDATAVVAVSKGDSVAVFYKVLKLGKRSYDGLSGEGTVVFSRGYGLEDDETKPGAKSFTFTVGDANIITALSDGIQGMKVGGTRRISILPQKGWEKATKECDGGPGGSGTGGELKTDYVVVPTATMVATEICFDKTKLPFPTTFAEERRMAQRFDQSLIMEVELVSIR